MVSSIQLKGVDNLATNKNITMKQFNGTDYDTLYPKTKVEQVEGAYTQQQILADSTKALFGLDSNAVPNDAFDRLARAPIPVGTICWYAKDDIPSGYLKCDGSAISRSNYSALFTVIGTVFGTGDGSTTFNIPDLRAKFIRGSGTNGNYSATFGQTQAGTQISHEVGTYSGPMGERFAYDYESVINVDSGSKWITTSVTMSQSTQSIGSNSPAYIRPYNIALTPIIKY